MKNYFVILTSLLIFFIGCNFTDEKTDTAADDGTSSNDDSGDISATFSSINENILQAKCVSCHGGSGGVTLESYAGVLQELTPLDPDASTLYTIVASGQMPKGAADLSDAEKQAIRDWITNGAEND